MIHDCVFCNLLSCNECWESENRESESINQNYFDLIYQFKSIFFIVKKKNQNFKQYRSTTTCNCVKHKIKIEIK